MSSPARAGKWLLRDYNALNGYLKKLICRAYKITRLDDPRRETLPQLEYHTSIRELKDLIESDAKINMYFTSMFTEPPGTPEGDIGKVQSYQEMLFLINHLMKEAPVYDEDYQMAGAPLLAILLYPMSTPSGTVVFLNKNVNTAFRKILNNWASFLDSRDSRYVLNQVNGWLSPGALKKMPNFKETFTIADSGDQYWGFTSWNDFFSRRLRPGARPIEGQNCNNVITSPCESVPYLLRREVKLRDTFWIKRQPYSMQHLLNNDPFSRPFEGGTVYQAFLDIFKYHRWHVPVDGTVVKAYKVKGSYYAKLLCTDMDKSEYTYFQSYLTNVASRAIIFIQADNNVIGLIAFVAIGMAEVSSCKIGVYEGQRVKKGDALGTFLYGGSSFVLCFRKGVPVEFLVGSIPEDPEDYAEAEQRNEAPKVVQVNAKLAEV